MEERSKALEEAAEICDRNAKLYAAYSGQERRPEAEREAFMRDALTCAELAYMIRNLKARP